MDDLGVQYTDKKVEQLERKLKQTYKQAGKEIEKKLQGFTAKSAAKEKTMLQKVADGKITQDEFDQWKSGHVFYGDSWKTQSQNIAHVLSNTNKVATQMINGEKADVFAFNMNYAAYDMEQGFGVNFGFDVYDEKTVERLLKDNPKILPKSSLSISKDEKWNMRNIRAQVTQGILQGDSIPKIAKRLAELVPERNANQMILHARTAMTSAQNGGRMERYKEAEALGIKFKKVWLATLDARTRPEHQSADGQAVKPDEPFIVGGEKMEYPGDPSADPSLIYNCRCTMVTELDDYPSKFDRRAYNTDNVTRRESYITKDTTYNEWMKAKSQQHGVTVHRIAQGKDISNTWTRRQDQFAFEIEDVINAQGFDGLPRVVSQAEFYEAVKVANGGEGFIAQRTYSAPNQETLDAYHDQLYNGKWYVDCSTGGAQYGQGMYCAANYNGELTSGIKDEMTHYQEIAKARFEDTDVGQRIKQEIIDSLPKNERDSYYGLINNTNYDTKDAMSALEKIQNGLKERNSTVSYTETFTLDPSAKVVTWQEIDKMMSLDKEHDYEWFKSINWDEGVYASLKGYDAINAEGHGKSGSYTVILNRTKVIFLGE